MKILFVLPSFPKRVMEYLALPSLELCILSAILKQKGHQVKMFDMRINQIYLENAEKEISALSYTPDIVLLDDSPETHCVTKKLINIFRKMFGHNLLIFMRGEIASFIPQTIMERNSELDFIVRYDDDFAFPSIVDKITNHDYDFYEISNIAFRAKDKVVITNNVHILNYSLDSLPMPDRNLFDVAKYLARDSETIVRSSRGCPSKCLFCIKTRYECFRLFSVQRFCDEIEELQKMGFRSFFFSDDTFAFSDKRLTEFAEEVRKRNLKIKFTSNIRITDINDYKAKTLKEIGAYRVFVGIETINSKSSKIINKNIAADIIAEKIDILKKYGLEFHASFILGAPNDTALDLEATIEFVNRINPTVVTYNLIKIYPGIPLYDNPQKYGIVMEDPFWYENDEWAMRCIMGTKDLPPAELEKWSRRMLWEFITKE